MKIALPSFDNEDHKDARRWSEKMRSLTQKVEQAFSKIRLNDSIIIGGGTLIQKHLSATTTWNPGSLSSGSQTTTTVTVTGAALGDEVTTSFSKSLAGLQMTGYVSAANTVTILLRNDTGAPVDLDSGTLRASVWRH